MSYKVTITQDGGNVDEYLDQTREQVLELHRIWDSASELESFVVEPPLEDEDEE